MPKRFEFDFQLDSFTIEGYGNREIITFIALSENENFSDTRSKMVLYARKVAHLDGFYEVIFRGKENIEYYRRQFIDVGDVLELNIEYHCRLIRYGRYVKCQIFSDSSKNDLLFEFGDQRIFGGPYSYLKLAFFDSLVDYSGFYSVVSGHITNIKFLN